jgi:hypothetical protein
MDWFSITNLKRLMLLEISSSYKSDVLLKMQKSILMTSLIRSWLGKMMFNLLILSASKNCDFDDKIIIKYLITRFKMSILFV